MSAPDLTLHLPGPEDTRAAAAAIATHLRAGDAVALVGELGAGKTCFVQGAAQALGVEQPVTSPSYVLVKLLPATVPVVHVDVYRLGGVVDLDSLGEDVLAPDVITVVEWADTITPLLPDDRLEVVLRHAEDSGAPPDADRGGAARPRRLELRALGPGWQPRWAALCDDLAAWAAG